MLARRRNSLRFVAGMVVAAGMQLAHAQQAAIPTPATSVSTPLTDAPLTPASSTVEDRPVPSLPGMPVTATPIAIVPVEGVELSGALNVAEGKAVIGTSGSVTAGKRTATITLPRRGQLLICATTKVSLTADSSVKTTVAPGLMMALDRGAIEAKFATGPNSDVILTPDFRILISGPGVANVLVRLGDKGDTCVDNRGPDAPYVAVSSIFDGGVYRVQSDQRVMFQHGSLNEVVDNERESCGCPPEPPTLPEGNEFPVAQSEGLTPQPLGSAPQAKGEGSGSSSAQMLADLAYNAANPASDPPPAPPKPSAKATALGKPPASLPAPAAKAPPVTLAEAAADASKPTTPPPPAKPKGGFHRIGRFFKRLFGG